MVEAPAYLLIGAAALFVLFAIARAMLPRTPRAERRKAQAAHSAAVSEGSDEKRSPKERAAALVRAGRLALEELGRPRLAARHAEWAHRLAPTDPEVIRLASAAFPRARRLRALERLLWLSAEAEEPTRHALDALIALYEGPMKRPERARALKRWAPSSP